ncbi:MAG: glycosyltransferase family 39 protein [Planctomycetes bacterium]|nr:glycosyltransferase family 39 protein [Planctomycetota bacterium]
MVAAAPTTDSPRERSIWIPFLAIVALAFVVRLVFLLEARSVPLFHTPLVDAKSYWDWSERIVAGDWMGDQVFYQAPLYPYFLAVVKLAVGSDLWSVRLVQIVLGALACGVIFLAGKELVSRRAGFVAGVALALYAPAIFFDALIQKANLGLVFTTLLLLAIARVQRVPSFARALATGVVLGLLMLTREETLLLVPVLALWLAFAASRGKELAVRAALLAAFALGLALVLTPVAWRNAKVGGEFVLTTSQAGTNFYIGNGPRANGCYVPLKPGRSDTAYERVDAVELAEAARGRKLTPSEVSSYWFDATFQHVSAHPGDWLAVVGRKLALLVNGYEVPDAEDQYFYERSSTLLRTLGFVAQFGVLLPLALAGVVLAWARRRELLALHLVCATLAIGPVLFYMMARYRYPLVPGLVLFAGFALAEGFERVRAGRAGRARSLALAGGLFLLLLVPCNWPIFSREFQLAESLHNSGIALLKQNEPAKAVETFHEALRLQPELAETWGKLGDANVKLDRVDDAIAAFERAALLRPENARYPTQLGKLWMKKQDFPRAASVLQRAVATPGVTDEAWTSLASATQTLGRWSEAIAAWRKARVLDPKDVVAPAQLAFLLATCPDDALRNGAEALAIATELASRAKPDDVAALDVLAAAQAESGRFDEALATIRRAIAVAEAQRNANLAQALRGRESAYAQRKPFRTGR